MGHTLPPKRNIVYSKLNELKRFANSVREPQRSRFLTLIDSVYQHISSIVFVNSMEDEEMVMYAMLLALCSETSWHEREKVMRCLAILIAD